ncbi:MAG: MopE-related protein [Sorangiineae bacterium]|nr:MopE-related protein [Polyangiaceae bacterium]MEB2320933.1 MopE-related protein [Sorangiineae bacterium]
MSSRLKTALVAASLSGTLALLSGCTTESFCFRDCGDDGGSAATGGAGGGTGATGGTGGGIDVDGGGSGGGINLDGGGGAETCAATNGGVEICDGIDNDCNGKADDGIDFTGVHACGTCANDCTQLPWTGVDLTTVSCTPPSVTDGTVAGTCKFSKCSPDYYDVDGAGDNGCEYYCQWNPSGTNTTDPGGADGCGKDDDCDGVIDEDVDVCADVTNCGKCGKSCTAPNGTPKCVSTATGSACDATNTKCVIDTCNAGYYDIDGSASNGCEYQCTPTGPELCDGLDNDCDGKIDNTDSSLETDDPNVGQACFGGLNGACADPSHQGVSKCIGGLITCCDVDSNTMSSSNPNLPVTGVRNGLCDAPTGPQVLKPGDQLETCNGTDDDCDGTPDNNPTDAGGTCGSSVGNCVAGTKACQSGSLTCINDVGPGTESCNGQDDDCDGVIDGKLATPVKACTTDTDCASGQLCMVRGGPADRVCATPPGDSVGTCDVPVSPPSGATSPCRAGTLACVGGAKKCVGSVTRPPATPDQCKVDANCDGVLTGQPDFQNDVRNCGSCGNDCTAGGGHITWTCSAGKCVNAGCAANYLNCNNASPDCETYCKKTSNTEQCNGVDDDCNCVIDDVLPANEPTAVQVCGVAAAATDAGCTTGVGIACTAGAWKCTFPAGYCDNAAAPNYCAGVADVCDGLDNNCNGSADETYRYPARVSGYLDQPCASDDGKPPPGDGQCRSTGKFVCGSNKTSTLCNATTDLSKASQETCDGVDNDCDSLIDEPKSAPGPSPSYVKPAVTNLGGNKFMFSYEASRPSATASDSGSGNGYQTSAPAGTTIDKTVACSAPSVVPWFNVTPVEAAQTCTARGGRLCQLTDWQTACHATQACTRGYDRSGGVAHCQTNGTYAGGTPARICNIGLFDFDPVAPGIQDGLLPTRSSALSKCFATWTTGGNTSAYDIEGNLREITWDKAGSGAGCNITDLNGNDNNANTTCLFPLMGGAFNTQSEAGASCDFTFYKIKRSLQLYDTGFRCCFDSDPT